MKPAEFIAFAGRVVALGPAGTRSAISRAYYGALHLALAVLRELTGEAPGSGRAHVLVPRYFGSVLDHDAQRVCNLLGNLHTQRLRADYRLNHRQVEEMAFAMECVEWARDTESHLDAFAGICRRDPAALDALRAGITRVKAIHK